jgi:PPOX class probable FMN-dependent enzyme
MIAEPAAPTTGTELISRLRANKVSTIEQLHAINGDPRQAILEKHTSYLTPLLEEFITAAPFFTVATADGDGNCDVSPKGDPPGAVRILDSRTIAIPDRLGNRRIDGHRNIIENPHIGLLFIIPNVDETVRVNGSAFITADSELLASMPVQGKTPKLAVIVEIDEVYMHCARSFLRAGMWKPETWPNPDDIPSLQAIACEQKELPAPDESAGKRQEEYRSVLY